MAAGKGIDDESCNASKVDGHKHNVNKGEGIMNEGGMIRARRGYSEGLSEQPRYCRFD